MKTILQFVIVGLCAWLFIWLDTLLYNFIISLIPATDWIRLIKVVIVVIMVIYTSGIVFILIAIASSISLAILNVIMPNKRPSSPLKSRFQQLLDEQEKKRNGRL